MTNPYDRNNIESVQKTADGGYILAGNIDRNNSREFWLIRTDINGHELWNKTLGGSKDDWGQSIYQTKEGGYIAAGSSSSFGAGFADILLIRTDSNGNELWQKTFGGVSMEKAYSVKEVSDAGNIIAGYRSTDHANDEAWLIRTDSNGNELWNRTFGGSSNDYGFSVQQTKDGGLVIVGSTASFGSGCHDIWLIKTDPHGSETWNKTFGGLYWDEGHSVQQTTDNGYIITGFTQPSEPKGFTDLANPVGSDIWIIKTDSLGNKEWDRTIDNSDLLFAKLRLK